ncbi:right-handed parallel beta-helix repeat-containing protein [Actinomadura miaoliensis]|uniref:Right handed beta helix domain-containing protein n=1 Tax=Actinomadura miaoliensis TaxID=430685 RepID=A0ABP7WNE8_9ACTN
MTGSSTRRTWIIRAAALPAVAAVAVLGWLVPRGEQPAGTVASTAGAAQVGSTRYPAPDGALYVAPSGRDSASGERDAPLRTVGAAIRRARSGGTVVLRGGTYHESVTIPAGKKLTLQAYPGEAVWFDGSSPVSGWVKRNGVWAVDGWTARFDSTPGYTKGAAPSSDDDFRFVDPGHPMAAHPDQVWIDGVAQRQVESRAKVKSGTFYVDEGARRLYVGTDPRGRAVRASTLAEAITVRGAGSTLRGMGVRRYATSIPQIGMVKVVAPDVTVENVAVTDSATTGLSVLAAHARVRRVTATRNGMLGVHANHADDLRLEAVRAASNNTEHFKPSPVAGGVKITRSRKVALVGGAAVGNRGKGLWLDESVYDITITGNRIARNSDHGISIELSAKAVVADNVVLGNGGDGLRLNDSGDAQIWNNTLTGNGRTVHLVQDRRRATDLSTPGHDPRQKLPDPTVPWLVQNITLSNNVLADARAGAPCLLCVQDHSERPRSAEQMRITANGNVYVRPGRGSPFFTIVWQRAGNAATYATLDAFRAQTGQEKKGLALDDPNAAAPDGRLAPKSAGRARPTPLPLPSRIAKLVNRPTGTRHTGAWTLSTPN